jgi:hypothetical protein
VAANRRRGKDSFTFPVQDGGMRKAILLAFLPLAGCGWSDNLIATALVGATVGSIATIQRTPADAVYSLLTGRDCSVVRLDQGKSYCRPMEPKPEAPAFCTRSLGTVNCWQDPDKLADHPFGVADGPMSLTAEQEANRVRRWP